MYHHLHDQAAFLAERLLAQSEPGNSMALELLADALLRNGESARVRWLLRDRKQRSPRLDYLLAVACLQLERHEEAQAALLAGDPELIESWSLGRQEALSNVVAGAPGLFIMGRACEGLQRRQQALECYAKCLEQCPFMWCAYERLSCLSLSSPKCCSSREFASMVFDESKFAQDPVLGAACDLSEPTDMSLSKPDDFQSPSTPSNFGRKRRRSLQLSCKMSSSCSPPLLASPGSVRSPLIARELNVSPLQEPSLSAAALATDAADDSSAAMTPVGQTTRLTPMGHLLARLSPRRLLSTPFLSSRRPSAAGSTAESTVTTRRDVPLASLMRTLGEAVHNMHRFSCAEALEVIKSLPDGEQSSALVQNISARCHFEMANYTEAARLYKECCKQHALYRPLGLEYYSNALWHLKDEVALGDLSQQVLQWDRRRAQVWCAVGNCFSLQQEHNQAIRCFRRAIQLDPNLAYAHTLVGHELAASETYDKAVHMYERAIAIDIRHYNAWWGLGNVFQRQEDFEKAKFHFVRALEINTSNDVLRTSLGMVLQCTGHPQKALQLFSVAASSKHCGALASFRKGCLLSSLGRHTEALEEFKQSLRQAPREACVQHQMGLAFRGAGEPRQALIHLTRAADLCSKDSREHQQIVAAMEELKGTSERGRDFSHETGIATPGSRARRRHQS
eukprot:TRINITY_DN10644_c0_g1_i1.p1 TRINITY_DN10644_c0_g1~~TRINITY_DN10644_c0_g1_i1.p1  ORF type:complete len:709 (-),score=114.11 TRINITY_DN10644_c0_g1_i1:80-2113(-)